MNPLAAHLRPIAKFIFVAVAIGAFVSIAIAMISARHLERWPVQSSNTPVGANRNSEDTLDWIWRICTPESWHAWGGEWSWPDSDHPLEEMGELVGEDWQAKVVAGGVYDVAWLVQFNPASIRSSRAGGLSFELLSGMESRLRFNSDHPHITLAPYWVPARLSRKCHGFLPGRSGEVGTMLRIADVPDGAWRKGRVEGTPVHELEQEPSCIVTSWRVDEVRRFGWPFRAFSVRGALVFRTTHENKPVFEGGRCACEVVWWTDGIGVDAAAGWKVGDDFAADVEALPAKGLPWRPMWLPLLGNALVLGVPLVMMFLGTKTGVRLAIARLRGGADRCGNCGYARQGHSEDARCPECGELPTRA